MTAIVIVSHSRRLGEGVRELAELMTRGAVPIVVAAGVGDDPEALGTDAVMVADALQSVLDDHEALVLMDQGSALLSAEMALELIGPEAAARVTLSSAPLVEGATAAAVAAAAGLPLAAVLAEAAGSLGAKRQLLGDAAEESPEPVADVPAAGAMTIEWTIRNPHGLHARPSARLVGALAGMEGQFILARGADTANALSLNQIARLGVRFGQTVTFGASGPDAGRAIDAFNRLCAENFGEAVGQGAGEGTKPSPVANAPAPVLAARPGVVAGIPVSDGVAVGPVARPTVAMPALPDRLHEGDTAEVARLAAGLDRTARALGALIKDTRTRLGGDHADIFEAHAALVRDPDLMEQATARIREGAIAEAAWADVLDDLASAYSRMEDEYARAREADVRDVMRRVLVEMGCAPVAAARFGRPVILVAEDLAPSDTAALDPAEVLGLCLLKGGRTSHSAILARALGIPAIAQAEGAEALEAGATVVLDGTKGEVIAAPTQAEIAEAEAERALWLDRRERERTSAQAPARTRDGFEPEILANIAGEADVASAIANGADGVGLLRTEFLFMGREALPDEAEQTAVYSRILDALDGRPLIIRTLDIGGDKPLPALQQAAEENPFLGLRGVRLCLAETELFDTQLRAIVRAAAAHRGAVRVMFPMISTVDEFRAAKARFERQRRLLAEAGVEAGAVPTGIMIEVPAAVLCAQELAREVDFFSIGTNDLTQYVMAADRGNGAVAELVDPMQPAVIRAIARTCDAAAAAGIPAGMCGEFAGNARATALLLGLGLTELSMSAGSLAAVKEAVRQTDLADARELAKRALNAVTRDDILALLTN